MLPDSSLTCPHCHQKINLSEAISHDLESALQQKLQQQFSSKEELLKKQLQAAEKEKAEALKTAAAEKIELQSKIKSDLSRELAEKYNVEANDLKNQLEEQTKRAKEGATKDLELRKIQRELEEHRQQQEVELQKRIEASLKNKESDFTQKLKQMEETQAQALKLAQAEKNKLRENLEQELSQKISSQFSLEQADLKNQLAEQQQKNRQAQAQELELRKQQRELEEKQHTMELEVQRKLDDERKRIFDDARRQAQSESSPIIEEQNLKMLALQKSLEDLRHKAAQGSQQTQGEALELKLEEELSKLFPNDDFEPVPKGIRGADLIQKVRSSSGKLAGTILWEFKQTKTWSDDWVTKLKEDQRELSAELAAIITNTLPKHIHHLGLAESVWVTQPLLAKVLAHTLREQILQVYQARLMNLIPGDQKEVVFKYLTGTKFKQSIEGEIDTVSSLLEDLQKEKKALTKSWASREQQLNQLLLFKSGLYGDLQGILGKSLPTITQLELGEPDDDTAGAS